MCKLIIEQKEPECQEITEEKSPLEYIVKFVTPPSNIRADRYTLQDKVQKILRDNTPDTAFKGIKHCMKVQLSDVAIHKGIEHNKAFYGNLATCSSVWACPVCSAKIQSRRAKEISKGMFMMYSQGYKAVMITFTHPHRQGMKLADNINLHNDALRKLRAGNPFTKFKKRTGYKGLIRGSEVTYGKNGWHFHTHEIWFIAGGCDIEKEREWLANRWYNACIKAGFEIKDKSAFLEHGIDLQDEVHSSDYLAKFGRTWGIDKEIAKGASKHGAGLTPFDLVEEHKELFIEYVKATQGKSQLFWSRGLKSLCNITVKSDEEINAEHEEKAEVIAFLSKDLWKCVKNNHARAEILDIAELYGFKGLQEWFSNYGLELKTRYSYVKEYAS